MSFRAAWTRLVQGRAGKRMPPGDAMSVTPRPEPLRLGANTLALAAVADDLSGGFLRLALRGVMPVVFVEGWGASGLAGFGEHPARRLLLGLLLSAILVAVWLSGRRGERWMLRSPTGAVLLAGIAAGVIAFDGGYRSPWFATSVAAAGLTVAAGFSGWAVAGAIMGMVGAATGYFVAGGSVGGLGRSDEITAFVGSLVTYAFTVLALVTLVRAFAEFVRLADDVLFGFRSEPAADSASLLVAGHRRRTVDGVRPRLPRADPVALTARLTPAEFRIVEQLASGLAAKQIAVASGVSLLTVRTQIKHAKRKTGARTLAELVAIVRAADASPPR
jgi:DNA-binding CsgD family transcriptional regulator